MMPNVTKIRAPQVSPMRIQPRDAAHRLSISYDTLHDMIVRGLFTIIAPKGRGRGKRIFLLPDEVQVYGMEGEEALREFRAKKKSKRAR